MCVVFGSQLLHIIFYVRGEMNRDFYVYLKIIIYLRIIVFMQKCIIASLFISVRFIHICIHLYMYVCIIAERDDMRYTGCLTSRCTYFKVKYSGQN